MSDKDLLAPWQYEQWCGQDRILDCDGDLLAEVFNGDAGPAAGKLMASAPKLRDALHGMLDMLKPDALGRMPSDDAKARYIHEACKAIAEAEGSA